MFVGRIESNIKTGKTVNGEPFLGFLLSCEPVENENSSINNQTQMISIRTFRANVIKYLQKVELKRNNFVVVVGFVSSYQTEVKGKRLTANSINANHIFVIKTK